MDKRKGACSTNYEVGYGRPPAHSRFQKGQSGNPKGRPRGSGRNQANKLALAEAYRLVTVREGEQSTRMPAFQAVVRAMVAQAAKGYGPAQRALVQLVQEIEAVERQNRPASKEQPKPRLSDMELAKRIMLILERGKRAEESASDGSD